MIINVRRISTVQLEQLNKKGITVIIPKFDDKMSQLESEAKAKLQLGDAKASRIARLKMFRLIQGGK